METVYEGFGFSGREREMSELEKEIGLVLKGKSNNVPEVINKYSGRFVEILVPGGRYVGVLIGVTEDNGLVLCPTTHRKPESLNGSNGSSSRAVDNYRWEARPKVIYGTLEEISEMSEDVLEAAAEGFGHVRDLGEYVDVKRNLFPYC